MEIVEAEFTDDWTLNVAPSETFLLTYLTGFRSGEICYGKTSDFERLVSRESSHILILLQSAETSDLGKVIQEISSRERVRSFYDRILESWLRRMSTLLQQTRRKNQEHEGQFRDVMNSWSSSLANRLSESKLQRNFADQVKHASIRNLLDYLASSELRNASRDELADMIGVSASHLSRVFKQETGESIQEFVSRKRLERSCELLWDEPDLSLKAVGLKCGFSTEAQYYTRFRQYTGMTPGQFRSTKPNRFASIESRG